MINCPDCGYENIPGSDQCEQCAQPLSALSYPAPASQVERNISEDLIEVLDPREPLMVAPDTSISQVLSTLVQNSIGCVLVIERDQLVGIFSERDALMRIGTKTDVLGDRPVSEFMTPEPQTLKATDKIAFALQRMDVGGFRHIPIVKDGAPVGIISVRDILRYLSNQLTALA